MKMLVRSSLLMLLGVWALNSAVGQGMGNSAPEAASATAVQIGGAPVVTLKRPRSKDKTQPQFLEATIAPGRGMNTLQIKAYLPGKGDVELLDPPSLADAKQTLDQGDDEFGNKGFQVGAGILIPYANRITGKLSADGKTIDTDIAGKTVALPANWHGKKPGATVLAMHGLILSAKFQDVHSHNGAQLSSVSGILHGGNFGGHWPSQTDVNVETVLKDNAVEINVTAKNVGKEPLPIGIAFHPWLRLLSGKRADVKLHVPADERALVNNYDDVLATGKVETVKGTPYDFTAPGGAPLGSLFMDDFFLDVKRGADGHAAVELTDAAANYGLRIVSLTPAVQGFQVYAPTDRNVIVVEPQLNLADPYNKMWGKRKNGMVLLQPGQSTTWRVRLELFVPKG